MGVIFEPWKVPPRDRNFFFLWGFFPQDCTSCVLNRQSLHTSAHVFCRRLAAPSLHTWTNPQSKPQRRDEKMDGKVQHRWLVLFKGGYLWSHRPACLPSSRHSSTDSACAARPHRETSILFLTPPSSRIPLLQTSPNMIQLLIFGVADGLDGGFSLFSLKVSLDNHVILFDRWEKKVASY